MAIWSNFTFIAISPKFDSRMLLTENKIEIHPPQLVYTPNAIVNLINNAISIKEERSLINVRGIYLAGPGRDYNGYFYDSLREESGACVLPLKISGLDRSRVKNGSVIDVKGFITRKVDDKGFIKVLINVSEVIGQTAASFSEVDLLAFELMQRKASKGFRDVEGFLARCVMEGRRPVVKIFVGSNAIVDTDIKHGFGESVLFYGPEFYRINFSQPGAIVHALDEDEADLVVLARGGGTGLEIFNSIEIAQAAVECKPLLITAIGHAEDVTLTDKIADRSFITPTELGSFFMRVYNKSMEQAANSKGKLIEQVTKLVKTEYNEKVLAQEKLLAERATQVKSLQEAQEKLLSERALQMKSFQQAQEKQLTTSQVILFVVASLIAGFILALLFKG